jgi:FkbM family methyltransferase
MKWTVGSGTHGYWLGSNEYSKRRRLERMLRPGQVFYDVGANVGFYTLVASALVGPTGHVAAFEPQPRNVEYLRRHIELNRIRNCRVLPIALGERPGRARFQRAGHPAMGSLASAGELEVEVASLDELVSRGVIPEPDVIKLDIEGGERLCSGARGRLWRIAGL